MAINRDGSNFDSGLAESMFCHMDCFGIDGRKLIVRDNFALGHQHFWTVPEERGEIQPLVDKSHGVYLAFHGRVDNRAELFAQLGIEATKDVSDAQLILQLYIECKDDFLDKIIGPFALLIYQPSKDELMIARDAMGGRHLNYRITAKHVLISTYEMSLVAHPTVDYQINQAKFIRWLAYIMEPKPTSFIEGLEVLLPGEVLRLDSNRVERSTFYLPDPKKRIGLASNQEYADRFRFLLTQAVERRLRAVKPIGTMLSGGMDSVPISITAAQLLAKNQQKLNSFSWVFDEHPDSDERCYSAGVCEDFGITPHWIKCDHVWPQFDETTHVDPCIPFGTEYSEFNQELLERANQEGVGVMLSGIGGDMLYSGTDSILIELLLAGRFRVFFTEAKRLFKASTRKTRFVKRLLLGPLARKLLGKRRRLKFEMPEYLTAFAQHKIKPEPGWLHTKSELSLRPAQYRNVLDGFEGDDAHYGKRMDVKYGIEKRFPLRDRDLVEFMLAVPVDQLYFNGLVRPIVKNAYQKEFREELIDRQNKTDFAPVVASGIVRDKKYQKWLNAEKTDWKRIVKQSYILSPEGADTAVNRVRWQLAYYEFWKVVCYNFFLGKMGKYNE